MSGGLCIVEGCAGMSFSCIGEAVGEVKRIDEEGEGGCSGERSSRC
jgi:hypothetical protein